MEKAQNLCRSEEPSPGQIFLGIDGGGTKTACVAMDRHEQIVGRAQAGPSNSYSIGEATARQNLELVIQATLADADATRQQVSGICLGIAGTDRPDDRQRVEGWVAQMLPGVPSAIYSDAVIALASGTGGALYGVVIICGTGMIVYGFDQQGKPRRAGGWGAIMGDDGGGYSIGIRVLKAITAAIDGAGPATMLHEALLAHLAIDPLAIDAIDQLIAWVYGDIAWHRFADLAPLAMKCAGQGDGVAAQIVAQTAQDLSNAAQAVIDGLHLTSQPFPLVLVGGNLRPGILVDTLEAKLAAIAPHAVIIRPAVEPAVGAALIAKSREKEAEKETGEE